MKKIYVFLSVFMYLNVFSQKNISFENYFYPANGKEYKIYKDTISNKYFLKNDKEKVKFKNYKYIANLSNQFLQCLDNKNEVVFFNNRFNKVKKIKLSLVVCGTVNTYEYEIVKKNDYYIITKRILPFQLNNDTIKAKPIDSISIEKANKIYFPNKEKKLTYDDNTFIFNNIQYYPETVIIEKDSLFGILKNNNVIFYDNITTKNFIIKLEKNHLVGYFGITKQIKYKTLDNFKYNLARFTLNDGRSGYIDEIGNEYYD